MKKSLTLMLILLLTAVSFALGEGSVPAHAALDRLLEGNQAYLQSADEDSSQERRTDTSENGQQPYAVVITCSDSRVPAELIFDAGIGELFVIRTAGNVIGDYELGSIEYGAEHLHAPLVVVMGHTQCGAVSAALSGEAHGHIADIVQEISSCLPADCEATEAEILNVQNSMANIRTSEIIQELEEKGEVTVIGAIYNIETGEVEFLSESEE